MDNMQTNCIEPLYPEAYPTLNDFDFVENFLSTTPLDHLGNFPDHLANLPDVHATPPENNPAPASNFNPTQPQPQRPLLPRTASEPAPAPMPMMYNTLPNSYRDSVMNGEHGERFHDIYQRLITIQNTLPTFRQISDLSARVTGIEARLTGMDTRRTNMDTRQTSTENRQATTETKLSVIEKQYMEL